MGTMELKRDAKIRAELATELSGVLDDAYPLEGWSPHDLAEFIAEFIIASLKKKGWHKVRE